MIPQQIDEQIRLDTWTYYDTVDCPTRINPHLKGICFQKAAGAIKNVSATARAEKERESYDYQAKFAQAVKWIRQGKEGKYLARLGNYTAVKDAWKIETGTVYHVLRHHFDRIYVEYKENADKQRAYYDARKNRVLRSQNA